MLFSPDAANTDEVIARINATTETDFTHEETYRLALESIERWGGNYRLSPAMRLRAIRAVTEAALSDQSV